MNLSKKEVQSIYNSEPGRITVQPIARFVGKDYGPCGNNILVDGQRTNVVLCILCRDDPVKSKSAYYMVSGTKNESANAKSHYESHHMAKVNRVKRTADQSKINFPMEKKCRFTGPTQNEISKYQQQAAIAIAKSNLALDFMAGAGADILISAILGKTIYIQYVTYYIYVIRN